MERSISISIVMHESDAGKTEEIFLKDVNDDLQSLYQQKAQAVFPFCLELNKSDMKNIVQVCLLSLFEFLLVCLSLCLFVCLSDFFLF